MSPSTLEIAAFLFLSASPVAAQSTWYVDVNGTPPGSGTQADPYTSLQDAIAQGTTLAGDTILVEPGTYVETIDFLGKDLIVQSTGGLSVTTLDGNDTGTVVRFVNGETQAALLDGFTVTNGRDVDLGGGGIRCDGASPRLRNLDVRNNAALFGAGIYFTDSAATLNDSVVQLNGPPGAGFGSTLGCGIFIGGSGTPVVRRTRIFANQHLGRGGGVFGGGEYIRCTISNNWAFDGAGAYGDLLLVDCLISGNFANGEGAAGVVAGARYATLLRCTVQSNFGGVIGGGVGDCLVFDSILRNNRVSGSGNPGRGGGAYNSDLYNCEIYRNQANGPLGKAADGRGGGLYGGSATDCRIYENVTDKGRGGGAHSATLLRCEIFDNRSLDVNPAFPSSGGGIAHCDAERCIIYRNNARQGGGVLGGTLTHCVVYGNTADVSNGGLDADGLTTVTNSVLWANDAPQIAQTDGTLTVSYSDVEGGWPGTGNFSLDPGLWAPMSGDVHLKSTSPCIDAGNPLSPTDPDGTRADVGVLPFVPGYCGAPGTYCTAKENSRGCIPSIGRTGVPGLTGADDFFITARDVRNNNIGVLFFGTAPSSAPFFEGTLCVSGAVQRYGAMNSGGNGTGPDCSGVYSFHITQQRMADLGFASEETTYWQILYRDPPQPDGTGVGLTDGLEVTFCP